MGHLLICFLAYLCQAYLTKKLRQQKVKLQSKATDDKTIRSRALTAPMAIHELENVKAIPVEISNQRIWVRTEISPNGNQLFKAIGMQIPPRVLKTETIL